MSQPEFALKVAHAPTNYHRKMWMQFLDEQQNQSVDSSIIDVTSIDKTFNTFDCIVNAEHAGTIAFILGIPNEAPFVPWCVYLHEPMSNIPITITQADVSEAYCLQGIILATTAIIDQTISQIFSFADYDEDFDHECEFDTIKSQNI